MAIDSTTLTVLLLGASLVNIIMFAIVFTQRGEKGAYPLMGIFLADGLWALTTFLVMALSDLTSKVLMHNLRFIGPTLTTLAIFVFALQYSGREEYTSPGYVVALAVVPVLTNVLVWTNEIHSLVRTSASLDDSLALGIAFSFGPWFLFHAVYSYSLSLGAQTLFVTRLLSVDRSDAEWNRTALLTAGAFLPLATSVAYVAGATPIDYTPFTLLVAGIIYVLAIFKY